MLVEMVAALGQAGNALWGRNAARGYHKMVVVKAFSAFALD
jgi:hypothetical protein